MSKKVVSSISGGEVCEDEDRIGGPSGNIIISTPSEEVVVGKSSGEQSTSSIDRVDCEGCSVVDTSIVNSVCETTVLDLSVDPVVLEEIEVMAEGNYAVSVESIGGREGKR